MNRQSGWFAKFEMTRAAWNEFQFGPTVSRCRLPVAIPAKDVIPVKTGTGIQLGLSSRRLAGMKSSQAVEGLKRRCGATLSPGDLPRW